MLYNFKTNNNDGVCCRWIKFQIDKNKKVHNIEFIGGCQGNQKAISILLEGKDANEIIDILGSVRCGTKTESCSSELCKGLKEASEKIDQYIQEGRENDI